MKFIVAVVVSFLYLAFAEAGIMDEPGYWYQHRERLGHFNEAPFIDLYKAYATAFVYPQFRGKREKDDFRNFLPSADECVVYLKKFQINDYQLKDVEEFVLLDACLGYLYQSDKHHEEDKKASAQVDKNLDAFINDEVLRALYEGTRVNSLPEAAKDCVGDLLWNAIRVKEQYPEVVCNNHYLQVYIEFAECHKEIPAESHEGDSYIKTLYELVKKRGQSCFDNEILKMNQAVVTKYKNNPFHVVHRFSWKKLTNQKRENRWPDAVSELLAAITGTRKEVSLRAVHEIFKGVSDGDQNIKQRLLNNLAVYANHAINPKQNKKTANDPSGAIRYTKMVDDLCEFFRTSTSEGYYDYATPFFRMLSMIKYPEVFGISEQEFNEKVFVSARESAAIYLSVSSCHILTFTEAIFKETMTTGPLQYKVVFRPDTSRMIKFPNAGYY